MGYQRSVWRSLGGGGGGGGGAVVRCSCSEEEVRISIRSVGEERLLRRVLTRRWFESPRLSVCSNERAPSATPSDSSEPRPLSLISTLSSGSGSSRDENPAPPPSDQTPALNLDLSSEGGPDRKGRSHCIANDKEPFVMAPQLTYLDRVVMEIIETERMYVRDLRMIVEDYLAHIIDQCDLSIRPEQVCALFGNIEDIYEFNSELLQALDLCDNDPVAVARCFVMKSEYFEIYTQYCTNYPNSVAALTECMRNKSLAKFFRERQALLKRSLPLGSYLLKPVQRILKYHLLLQEIAKHFDPMEEGYEVVEDAIYTMTGVAWYINDMKRKHEHAVRLQEVQSLLLNWKGPDLTTYGELVLEGTFKVHRAKNERTLFLFDHMLLITKRRGEHFVYKTHISVRFNSNQNDESVQTNPSAKSLRLESNSALPTGTWADIVTDDCLDPLKSDMVNKEPEDSGESTRTRSQSVQDNPCEEEEFRPSSEMIKIWQTMEQEINRSEDRGCDRSREAQRKSRATHDNLSETPKTQNKICDRDSGASDLSTITEESTSPSPLKHKVPGVNHTGNLKDSLRTFREEAAIFRAPVPRVAQLRAEVEGERPGKDLDQLDETDKTNSKVLHLARQYSQRLKTTTPVVRQRSQGLLIGKKSLPCVLEEKENAGTVTSCLPKGKPNLTLPLVSHSQASSLPLSPVDQIQSPSPGLTCSSVGSSRVVSPGRARSHSPPSPTPPTENFNWPDVRELRSKYSNPARPQKSTVSRSRSIPEKMSDGGLRRHSSCSSSLPRMDEASCEVPSHKPCGSWDAGREERTKRLLRANSLDPRLSAEQMTELQKLKDQVANDNDDGYYIAAEAVLPNDPEHKIIVMEKLPDLESEPESEPESETAKKESKKEAEEEDDSYIQIRSPTSREKISIMAVIDRCRAYQESDEYKQREEVRAKTEPTRPQELDISVASTKDQDVESQKTSSNSGLKVEAGQQSIVKNLRDKFQNLS
ncbi:uncharacterized protein [Labrus bergylta]|uniref:uncharacterized protein n=1 Tax=Labrus bergylta TaxID=56723 RepID=UPI00331364B4